MRGSFGALLLILILGLALTGCAAREPAGKAPAQIVRDLDKLAADIAATRTFRDCADCPVMVALHSGRFVMGAQPGGPYSTEYEQPRHDVQIDYGFSLGQSPVTRREFAAFVKDSGYVAGSDCAEHADGPATLPGDGTFDWSNPGFKQTDSDPVVCLNAVDIKAYIDWLSKRSGKRYRLPSEAEWEYAAKAGNYEDRYFPDDPAGFCRYVNGADADFDAKFPGLHSPANNTACRDGYVYTSPVGSFPPNPFGLNDMIGNVMQILADGWHGNYQGAPADGRPWAGDGSSHVLRGGSWFVGVGGLSAVWRTGQNSDWRLPFAGFRLARDGAPQR